MMKRKRQRDNRQNLKVQPVIVDGDDEEEKDGKNTTIATLNSNRMPSEWLTALLLFVVACVVSRATGIISSTLRRCQIVTLLPVCFCLYLGVFRRQGRQRILPLVAASAVLSRHLPVVLASALGVAALLIFSLATREIQRPSKSPTQVIVSVVLMVTVLLSENFMIWVVSATFPAGQQRETAPPPLQDNGQWIVKTILYSGLTRRQVVNGLRRLWNVQWTLAACMGVSFGLADAFHDQLYDLACRAVVALTVARFIRTVSFLWTVLPSPVQNCYAQRFPYPPPDPWTADWVWTGIQPAAHGGCNDLIVSGHATVTSTLACISTSVAADSWFSAALWIMVLLDYSVEIYEGFHYSVDMWMGWLLVTLLWRVTKTFGIGGDNASKSTIQASDIRFVTPSLQQAFLYALPSLIVYLQLVAFPAWSSNFVIVGLIAVGVGLFVKSRSSKTPGADMHLAQHTVLNVLLMALGIYL